MQQIIDYINKKLEKYSQVVSDMDKKYIWNEIKYTYHGWFDHGYAKWKLTALEDMKDELQDIPENNSQAIDILKAMKRKAEIKRWTWCWYMIETLDEAIHKIEALWDGWIQTSIRLPEPHKNVLLWEWWYEPLELNEPIIGWYDTRYWFRTKWDWPIATHWMPLPLPPKQ